MPCLPASNICASALASHVSTSFFHSIRGLNKASVLLNDKSHGMGLCTNQYYSKPI